MSTTDETRTVATLQRLAAAVPETSWVPDEAAVRRRGRRIRARRWTGAASGGVLVLAQHGSSPAVYSPFRGEPSMLSSLIGIFRGVAALDSLAIVQLGLVMLIATPVLRVAFTLVAFAIQRDRTYVFVTALVLALLLYGLLYGRA